MEYIDYGVTHCKCGGELVNLNQIATSNPAYTIYQCPDCKTEHHMSGPDYSGPVEKVLFTHKRDEDVLNIGPKFIYLYDSEEATQEAFLVSDLLNSMMQVKVIEQKVDLILEILQSENKCQ